MNKAQSSPQVEIAGDAHFNGGTFHNVEHQTVVNNSDELKDLKTHSAPTAIHTSREVDSQGICTPGTRERTLKHIRNLVTSPKPISPDIVWMHGPAGAGKSAIMRTTAQSLEKEGLLLASFFFFHSESKRNTSIPFIPTLTLQAFVSLPQTQNHILHSIRQQPTVFSQAPHLQCLHLLQTPLINLLISPDVQAGWPSRSSRVIVVDGLDECKDDGGQEEIIQTLAQLASAVRTATGRRLKILIASRPELRIKTEFERLRSQGGVEVICLDSSDAELHLFYAERFAEIRRKYRGLEHWPSIEDLEWLMDKTSGHYSFADISTRHLAGGDPILRLQTLRKALIEDGLNPFQPLDVLYTTIFQQLPPEMLQPTLLILRLRLGETPRWSFGYVSILEPLFQLPQGFVSRLSPHLSSLINFDNDLSPYHASLSDFLHDPCRSGSLAFAAYQPSFDRTFTKGVFAVLSAGMRQPDFVDTWALSQSFFDLRNMILARPSPENYPPSHEIIALIEAFDFSQFNFLTFSFFAFLFKILHPFYIDTCTPNSATILSLNCRMEATWQEKTALYGQCCSIDGTADLIIGLMLLCFTTSVTSNSYVRTVVASLIEHIIQSNEELCTADLAGWGLLGLLEFNQISWTSTCFLERVLEYEDSTHTSKCLQVVFDATLNAGNGRDAHPLVADFIHCGKVDSLENLQRCIVCCWCWTWYTAEQVPTLAHFDSVYHCIQSGDWVSWGLVDDLHYRIQRALRFPGDSPPPSFANPQEEQLVRMYRELEKKLEDLKRAEADLGQPVGIPHFYRWSGSDHN